MPETPRLFAGAMSGTSADGIDVAIVEITGTGWDMSAKLIRHHARPYDAALKQAIFAMRGSGQISLAELARLGREISLAYATCVNEALALSNLTSDALTAIAAHGQTLFHDPPNTIQWLDPALIAAETRCAVISDFRRADCAAGGQGAPLVPFADYVLLRDSSDHRVMLNLGGIANVTSIPAGAALDDVIGFDTGPANCLSDHVMRTHAPDSPGYDVGGKLAADGCLIESVAQTVLSDPFFAKPPPKSLDIPNMIRLFDAGVEQAREQGIRHAVPDLLYTACWITAESIAGALSRWAPTVDDLIFSGGGIRNETLRGLLSKRTLAHKLPLKSLGSVDAYGIASEAKEALAFALLAAATLDGFPSNVPSCTGAKRQVLLGIITPQPY
ncbi:MAG: anmK [Phycisphaerales bacterium]|nr:anmK [Phycisphaerales bacterium]